MSHAARHYELMTIVSPDSSEDELVSVLDRIAGYVATAGGEVVSMSRESPWGRRRLAYPIRHNSRDVRDGFYTLFTINLPPAGVSAIERELKLTDRLMRYLVVLATPKPPEVTPEGEAPAEASAAPESSAAAPADVDAAVTADAAAPVETETPASETEGSAEEPTEVTTDEIEGDAEEA